MIRFSPCCIQIQNTTEWFRTHWWATTNRFLYCCRDYFSTLEVVCERGPKENYGLLNWTVAEETDDVVYYQSYTHEVSITYVLFSALEQKILFSVINDNILESWLENQSTERGGKLRGLCWRVCSSGHPPPGPIEHSQYNSVRSQSTTKVSGSIKVIQLELTNGTRSFCEIKYDYFLRS